MHELIQSEIQSNIISEISVTSGGSVPFPFREIYPTAGMEFGEALEETV